MTGDDVARSLFCPSQRSLPGRLALVTRLQLRARPRESVAIPMAHGCTHFDTCAVLHASYTETISLTVRFFFRKISPTVAYTCTHMVDFDRSAALGRWFQLAAAEGGFCPEVILQLSYKQQTRRLSHEVHFKILGSCCAFTEFGVYLGRLCSGSGRRYGRFGTEDSRGSFC